MIYYAKIDENGYVTDLTCLTPAPEDYIEITIPEVPEDIIYGYYKWNDGFELDSTKKAIIDAELDNAQGPGLPSM